MDNPCLCHHCVNCCLGTEMLLLDSDVERLAGRGFLRSHFMRERDGWIELRNRGGRCAFNDGERCIAYEDRPEGCRSYPVAMGRGGAVLDRDCPYRGEFSITNDDRKRLANIAAKLKAERSARKRARK